MKTAMADLSRKSLALALIGFCVVAIYYSVSWGLADYFDATGYSEMKLWRTKSMTAENWRLAHENINRAVNLDPTNPKHLRRLARLYRDKVNIGLAKPKDQATTIELAREELLMSLRYRPRHGDTWAELALVKHMLGEPDDEMENAIHQAVTWAPWEGTTNILLTEIGLYWFEQLSDESREEVIGAIVRGLRSPQRGPNVYREVWSRLESHPQHHHVIIQAFEPTLAQSSWPKATRTNFARLADWSWPVLTEFQQQELARAAFATIETSGRADRLFALFKVEELRDAVCELAEHEKFSLATCD